jgi:hypothetical protein
MAPSQKSPCENWCQKLPKATRGASRRYFVKHTPVSNTWKCEKSETSEAGAF